MVVGVRYTEVLLTGVCRGAHMSSENELSGAGVVVLMSEFDASGLGKIGPPAMGSPPASPRGRDGACGGSPN